MDKNLSECFNEFNASDINIDSDILRLHNNSIDEIVRRHQAGLDVGGDNDNNSIDEIVRRHQAGLDVGGDNIFKYWSDALWFKKDYDNDIINISSRSQLLNFSDDDPHDGYLNDSQIIDGSLKQSAIDRYMNYLNVNQSNESQDISKIFQEHLLQVSASSDSDKLEAEQFNNKKVEVEQNKIVEVEQNKTVEVEQNKIVEVEQNKTVEVEQNKIVEVEQNKKAKDIAISVSNNALVYDLKLNENLNNSNVITNDDILKNVESLEQDEIKINITGLSEGVISDSCRHGYIKFMTVDGECISIDLNNSKIEFCPISDDSINQHNLKYDGFDNQNKKQKSNFDSRNDSGNSDDDIEFHCSIEYEFNDSLLSGLNFDTNDNAADVGKDDIFVDMGASTDNEYRFFNDNINELIKQDKNNILEGIEDAQIINMIDVFDTDSNAQDENDKQFDMLNDDNTQGNTNDIWHSVSEGIIQFFMVIYRCIVVVSMFVFRLIFEIFRYVVE